MARTLDFIFGKTMEGFEQGSDIIRVVFAKNIFGLLVEVLLKGVKAGSRQTMKALLCNQKRNK